jgi:branched-chain amino acid transport system ATP-binding protein
MLEITDFSVHYGAITAVNDVNLEVRKGEILAILGANGAGKSTLLRSVMGLVPQTSGGLVYKGQDISDWSTRRRVQAGLSLVPEGGQVFPRLTCRDNLRAGMLARRCACSFEGAMRPVLSLFPRLEPALGQRADSLSGGEQQMLAIGRALVQGPDLLLLDEPSRGLAPKTITELMRKLQEIRSNGTTVVLAEQQAKLALPVADRAYVLTLGAIADEGPAGLFAASERFSDQYFGIPSRSQ